MYGAYYPYLYGRAGPSRPFYQYDRVSEEIIKKSENCFEFLENFQPSRLLWLFGLRGIEISRLQNVIKRLGAINESPTLNLQSSNLDFINKITVLKLIFDRRKIQDWLR